MKCRILSFIPLVPHKTIGGFPGGQAEYVRVPKGEVNCLPIPDDVSDEEAIYLSDVLPTSYVHFLYFCALLSEVG